MTALSRKVKYKKAQTKYMYAYVRIFVYSKIIFKNKLIKN